MAAIGLALRTSPVLEAPLTRFTIGLGGERNLSFIDQPIRTYSTGMVARLAFAVATTVDAHILLLDEVLVVGDVSFRQKCRERLEEFRDAGVTILLVSHDLEAVELMCDDVLWLDKGRLRAFGPAADVVADYKASVAEGPTVGGAIETTGPEG